MAETDRWLEEYGASHQQIAHAPIYWTSVLVLAVGAVGLLWSLPVPGAFGEISPLLNWGTTFLLAAIVYYFIISMPLAIGMLPFVAAVILFHLWLVLSPWSAVHASAGLTLAGLLGIAIGRFRRGGLRGVLADIQLMMIAPLWLLSRLYRRLGIPH